MSTPPPCYNRKTRTDCPRRAVGCRATCPEWQEYEVAHAAENAARAKAKAQEAGLYEHYHAVRKRVRKDTGHTPRNRKRKGVQ